MSELERPTPGMDPTEGPDDLGIPGADTGDAPGGSDVPDQRPAGRETERRDDLADRVGSGGQGGAGADRPDLITGTDVPEGQM